MILEKKKRTFKEFTASSYVSASQLVKLLEKRNEFKDDLTNIFSSSELIEVGNAKRLIEDLIELDNQCEKIDINIKTKDFYLKTMLEGEKALFEILNISDKFILKETNSSSLIAETRYSAKNDILDQFDFSRFANYSRDKKYDDLIDTIVSYLKDKNSSNNEEVKFRLLFQNSTRKFYIRSRTSSQAYKDFGINFSVFVALKALGKYVRKTKNEIFIDSYTVDDSNLYVSFSLTNEIKLENNIFLSISLILKNDEIKRNAVSFNGAFKLRTGDSEIYVKPKGIKREKANQPVDLLTYPHKGSVDNVFKKIEDLPELIELFIEQAKNDAPKIAAIDDPNKVKELIAFQIHRSRTKAFQGYKKAVYDKLMAITVDSTLELFDLLGGVEELFDHDDILSRDFWRTKLYEVLINKK